MVRSRHRISIAAFVFALAAATVAAQPDAPPQSAHYTIAAPVADLHSRAAADSDVVSQAIFGAGVTLLERDHGWAKIRMADDYQGWIRENEVVRLEPEQGAAKTARVESLFATLYQEPDIEKHAPVITLPYGARLEVTAQVETPDGLFHRVRLPAGAAWVQHGDVSFADDALSIADTIALAKRFLGLTYRWGGTSSFGFDCSGFTQMLMSRRGVAMPRDTRPQARWEGLAPVERDALQPGDLVFFGKTREKINHTGMYIGNGQFIHATRRGHPGVQIGVLDQAPWTVEYITARRAR